MLRTLYWTKKGVIMLDQRLLPGRAVYRRFTGYRDVADAIKKLVVRGAPAIGVAAAMGAALGAIKVKAKDADGFKKKFKKVLDLLASTRPTAVNLFWAIERMRRVADSSGNATAGEIKKRLVKEARKIYAEDIRINKLMGGHGSRLIKNNSTVLTHCNAGALATAGYGTALGVIRGAVDRGKKIRVFADETRPVLQGARLTAWELKQDKIDCILITDNMAGSMMQKGLIDCVVVGADRIAANGDVANKIGTYPVAVLAKAHNIPFYVAAPLSTIDMKIKHGNGIPIEERDSTEVTHIRGKRIAPAGIKVRNPAFDVTPNRLVTAIITEKGVVRAPYGRNIRRLFS
ncbi:MAG: S-methyl-5-thioribose-1-phosphate isomerase [Deltaproteobacteria bacterium]|nr:S-methyl-5-thioribose-1-phosphate isomerase [Deltaproteobacteria bacterium]